MRPQPASFRTVFLLIFITAVPLSFAWEMLQMVAYAPFGQSAAQTWFLCGLASLVDAAYIAALYGLGKYFTHDDRWFAHLTGKRLLIVAIAGTLSATIMERIALTFSLWRYSDAMLRVPVLEVGIIPLLQLSVLPLLTFWVVNRLVK